jgi:phosphopantothenoylcysteine decarboxylase/phosphopantothenate--cysteine ligase
MYNWRNFLTMTPATFSIPNATVAGATDSSDEYYLRNPDTAVAADHSEVVIIRKNNQPFSIRNNVHLVRHLTQLLREPKTLTDLAAASGISTAELAPVMNFLTREQIVSQGTREQLDRILAPPAEPVSEIVSGRHLVVGLSGAVQTAVTLPLLLTLKRCFARQIDVILTTDAQRFITADALSSFGFSVWTGIFDETHALSVPHIVLAERADAVLILPASAHTIHRLATGECSDLLSLVVSATTAPVIVAPAMNPRMLAYLPIRRNIELLREAGLYVVEPSMALEVSNIDDTDRQFFSGVGLGEPSRAIVMLEAILSLHKPAVAALGG